MTPSLFNVLLVFVGGVTYGLLLPVSRRAAIGTAALAGLMLGLAAGVRAWAGFTSPTVMDTVLLTANAGFEAQPVAVAYACVVGLVVLSIRGVVKRAT